MRDPFPSLRNQDLDSLVLDPSGGFKGKALGGVLLDTCGLGLFDGIVLFYPFVLFDKSLSASAASCAASFTAKSP